MVVYGCGDAVLKFQWSPILPASLSGWMIGAASCRHRLLWFRMQQGASIKCASSSSLFAGLCESTVSQDQGRAEIIPPQQRLIIISVLDFYRDTFSRTRKLNYSLEFIVAFLNTSELMPLLLLLLNVIYHSLVQEHQVLKMLNSCIFWGHTVITEPVRTDSQNDGHICGAPAVLGSF